MTKLDFDNDLISLVTRMELQLEEVKGLLIAGSDSVRTYPIVTDNEWDMSINLTSANSYAIDIKLTIEYQPDSPVMATLSKFPAGFHLDSFSEIEVAGTILNGVRPRVDIIRKDFNNLTGRQVWDARIVYSNPGTATAVRVKFITTATGKGKLTIIS